MNKYRKKPIVVEAIQWFPGIDVKGVYTEGAHCPYTITIHGQRAFLVPGDWVIREADGVHCYPCKPDIFGVIYEPVENV